MKLYLATYVNSNMWFYFNGYEGFFNYEYCEYYIERGPKPELPLEGTYNPRNMILVAELKKKFNATL